MNPTEQIALWADKLRDMAATGLQYAPTIHDLERYKTLQTIAMEMTALATSETLESLEPFRTTFFSRPMPLVAAAAAVIDDDGLILLMRRSDNRLWVMPGGSLEVGETCAAGAVREAFEETGVRCAPMALVGVYDSQVWDSDQSHHMYKFTFLCKPLDQNTWSETPSHAAETLDIGWFLEDELPDDLYQGHRQRIQDAFHIWRGNSHTHFDR